MYISSKFREKVIGILASAALIEELKEDEAKHKTLFGRGWPWLKQANTLITKAMREGLSEVIGTQESEKIHKMTTSYRVLLMRNSEPPPKNYKEVEMEKLHTLAEMAMGNQCNGCTIKKFKKCPLFEALHAADIPPSCEENGKCPYLQ